MSEDRERLADGLAAIPGAEPTARGQAGMSDQSREAAAARLRLALELYEAGERMMVQKWRRERPDATDAEIEALLLAWLRERPGAEHGDAEGQPVPFPRRPR